GKGEVCSLGKCATTCGANLKQCKDANSNDVCVDTKNDPSNCGACNTQCAAGKVCQAGACEVCSAAPLFAMRSVMKHSRIAVNNSGFARGSGPWTFEFWVRIHGLYATSDPSHPTYGHLFDMNENYAAYAIRPIVSYERKLYAYTYNDTSGPWNMSIKTSPIPALDTGWHHFAMVYDGDGSGRAYLDGVLQGAQTGLAPIINATSTMAIGSAAGYFPGYETAPVSLGGIRYSKTARYTNTAPFAPASSWSVDENTIAQYLTKQGLGDELVDEAGGDNNGKIIQGWVVELP
ncbi:MAG: hypothetical protein FJ095_09580, partial [Deltaproteobacteria bacterium]|nr:hypothetical protein [Deltaproteobacteria bacterium]